MDLISCSVWISFFLLLTSGLIWRCVAPCALSSHTQARISTRRSDFTSDAITWLPNKTIQADFALTVVKSSSWLFIKTWWICAQQRDRLGEKRERRFSEIRPFASLQLLLVQRLHSSDLTKSPSVWQTPCFSSPPPLGFFWSPLRFARCNVVARYSRRPWKELSNPPTPAGASPPTWTPAVNLVTLAGDRHSQAMIGCVTVYT